MKHTLRYTLLFAIVILVAASCKKAVPEQTKYIPKDALLVLDLNWKSLSDKASKGNINWDSLYTSVADADTDSMMREGKKMMQDFMRSGIDTTKDIFFFMKMGGSIMSGQQVSGGVVGAMKDAAAFESYIKKQPQFGEIQKGSNYSYVKIAGSFNIGWNSDVVIVAGAENAQNFQGESGSGSSSTISGDAKVLAALFAQKEEESVASIPEFRDLMAEKGDMLFWSNSSSAFSSVPFLGMTKIADLFKDSYGAGVINFEDGKITANFKSYSGKDLAAIWEKYKGPQVDMNMVNQFPLASQGYAAFSFNPQIIAEMVKYGGFESTVKQTLEKAGFTMEDVLKIFKGDFAIVFGGVGYEEASYTFGDQVYKSKKPAAKVIFNATIGDKAAYDKVISKLAEGENDMFEMKNGQYVPKQLDGMAWSMDGKNLIIATDSLLLQQYLAGKGNAAIPANIADRSKGKSMAMYVDINNILGSLATDSIGGDAMKTAQATFNDVIATSDNYNGKFVASNIELKMKDEKQNSLVSLVKFFAEMSKEAVKIQNGINRGGMTNLDDLKLEEMPDVEAPPGSKAE
ncbi:hypothetical protein BH10BAC2_BH10BAC2_30550 [soil metagenome]